MKKNYNLRARTRSDTTNGRARSRDKLFDTLICIPESIFDNLVLKKGQHTTKNMNKFHVGKDLTFPIPFCLNSSFLLL